MKRARSVCAAIAATAFALTVVVAVPSPAVAETSSELQAQLDKAKATRDDYYAQAEAVSDQLNATREQLSETESQIADTQKNIDKVQEDIKVKEAELARRQALLAENVSENYKSGGVSLLSLVLEANSFDDFVTRVYYADKISETQASNIEETNRLRTDLAVKKGELDNEKATLEYQKSQQEQLVSQQEAQQADLKSKVDEADSYVNSLDSQVKEARAHQAGEVAARMEGDRLLRSVGQTVEVLFEEERDGLWRGHTSRYSEVRASSAEDLHNRLRQVCVTGIGDGYLEGLILNLRNG